MPDPIRRPGAGRWVVALTVIFAVAAMAALFRPLGRNRVHARPTVPMPKVDVARLDEGAGDKLLREQANIFDPTPLFLPTKWNTSQRPLPAAVGPQPGQVFSPFGAQLVYGKEELALPIEASRALPKSPLDLLNEPSRDPFVGFDRQDLALAPLPARFGVVEVRRMDSVEAALEFPLDRAVILPAGRLDWQPAEYVITVTVGGLLGRPANTASSDVEEVDVFLRDYLSKNLHLGERLAPGIYRVVVGP